MKSCWTKSKAGSQCSAASTSLCPPEKSSRSCECRNRTDVDHMAQGALPRPRLGVVLPDVPLAKAVVR